MNWTVSQVVALVVGIVVVGIILAFVFQTMQAPPAPDVPEQALPIAIPLIAFRRKL